MPLRHSFTFISFIGSLLLSSLACAADSMAASTARVLPLADNAYAGSSINVVANSRQSLFTEGRTQYAAFYDADGFMVLAKRTIGEDRWQTQRTAHKGNVADAHNSISLAVDGAGYLHVSWNHHVSPLHYARSIAPGSLELAPATAMTGKHEERVTYPQFFRLPSGDLLFAYRDGESGKGALVLNRYTTASNRWSTIQPNLIDGEGQRSPYWGLWVDRKGTLHLAWIWRESPDVATNHDIAYARSSDGGVTWTRSDGAALALPITAATAEYAQRIPQNSNLMNSPDVGADRDGHPYICTYWSPTPGAKPQFHVLMHDGKTWQLIPGPVASDSFNLAGAGTRHPPISRAALLVDTPSGYSSLHLVYRDDARGGRIIAATWDSRKPREWADRELTTESVGAWEPAFDPIAWDRFHQVHLLVQNVSQRDGDDRTPARAEPSKIVSLIWAPASEHMRASATSEASALAAKPDDRTLDPTAVLAIAQRASDWQWAHMPAPEQRHPRGWETAPFYIGVLALDRVSPDHRNRERMLKQAEALGWQLDTRLYHADDQCVIQAYYELYEHYREPRMIEPSKKRFDEILAHPSPALLDWGKPGNQDRWSWCDALFMAPVAWLQTWKETGNPRYLDFMNREWWATTDRLYRADIGFYFRDESYLDLREPNGKTIHWSRGNGWVFAGLARVLDLFPKDHPDYPRYVTLYRQMAASVLAAQQADGLWRAGLLDPATHTARETSGSSFYTFGLAWGVNRGLLDRNTVEPAVRRGWNAIASSVTAEGKLEDVQPIGAAPEGFDPHHTDLFAVGAFLLAASEVHQLAEAK